MSSVTNWKIVAYVQIIFFFFIGIAHCTQVIMALKARKHTMEQQKTLKLIIKYYCVYLSIFVICKIAGGVCALVLYHQKNYNTGLLIATYVFDSISLGMLIKCFTPMLTYFFEKRDELNHGITPEIKYDPDYIPPKQTILHPIRALTLILLAAVITSIVGTSSMTDSGSTTEYLTLIKVSAFLFLAAIILITLLLIAAFLYFSKSCYQFSQVLRTNSLILLAAMPLFFIRVIYSLLSAFSDANIAEEKISKYTLLFGQYEYYTFLAFIEECIVSIVIIFNMAIFNRNVEHLSIEISEK